MTDRDPLVADTLDRLVPNRDSSGAWADVLCDAAPARRRSPFAVAAVPVAVLLAVAAAALLWPFGGQQQGILDRALAAVGDGPIIHVVLRGEWEGTVIDLKTEARQRVYGERELWYDPQRGVRQIVRFGGAVQQDTFSPTAELGRPEPKVMQLLGEDYRDALASGRVRDLGPGEAYGELVYWLRVDQESLPDGDGKLQEWAHDVGVSQKTFEPVATRETVDGKPGPGTGERILELEALDRGDADLTPSGPQGLDGTAFSEGREAIDLGTAAEALGRTPLWLGRTQSGLPLAQVLRKDVKTGRSEERLLTGQQAEDVRECLARRSASSERPAACERLRELGHGVSLRGANAYVRGAVVWGPEHHGVSLLYGELADEPSTYRSDARPALDRPHVMITEASDRLAADMPYTYDPKAGTILVTPPNRGYLEVGGLHLSIDASSEDLLLAAARALEPVPG
jgi:hypothetical protein